MPNIITLLNNSDFYTNASIKELFDYENLTKKSQFENVMIKALFGTSHEILTIDDISIICNGHIYNNKQLLSDLKINLLKEIKY